MSDLTSYLLATRRLLHDASGQFWQDSELTDYINEARNRVAIDSGCLRQLQSFALVAGQEVYPFTALPLGAMTFDIINVTVIWGNSRYLMGYMPYTQFTSWARAWTSYVDMPSVFSVYGQNSFYIGPSPSQAYACEFDTIILPNVLVNASTVEQIVYPYTGAVQYYAAYLAKEKEQMYTESDRFMKEYENKLRAALRASYTRRIPLGQRR